MFTQTKEIDSQYCPSLTSVDITIKNNVLFVVDEKQMSNMYNACFYKQELVIGCDVDTIEQLAQCNANRKITHSYPF